MARRRSVYSQSLAQEGVFVFAVEVYGNRKTGNPPRVVTQHGTVALSSAQAVGGDQMMFSRQRQHRAFAIPLSLGIALVLLFGPPAVWAAPAPAPQPGPTLQQLFK